MTRLTRRQRFALAREARILASECAEGTAPKLGHGQIWYRNGRPCCAVGHILARAGLHPEWADAIGARRDVVLATTANDSYPDSLPWALLSLADALETAGASKTQEEAFKEQK